MRLPLAIAALAAVLTARATAHAAAAPSDPLPTGRIVVERCIELPMSLALQIAEAEAARSLTARSLSSNDEPVNATPAPRRAERLAAVEPPTKPFSPMPHACTSPGEPGCEVSGPGQAPTHVQIARVAHDGAVPLRLPDLPPPNVVILVPAIDGHAAPTSAHTTPPWRPPAR
jgi:hypothetical protein